jgi:predicted transcriptional regulator
MAKQDPQLRIRVPKDVKDYLAKSAKRNASSQNSEIVRSIRERMDRERAQAAPRPAAG